MSQEVSRHLSAIESDAGRRLGQPDDPLLVSVRSGARFSMPGMMETVLDIGLNDDSVMGLAKVSGNERFAWDSYRRLIQMYGSTVMGVDGALFDRMMTRLKELRGAPDDLHLDAADLAELVEAYKQLVHEETGDYDTSAWKARLAPKWAAAAAGDAGGTRRTGFTAVVVVALLLALLAAVAVLVLVTVWPSVEVRAQESTAGDSPF